MPSFDFQEISCHGICPPRISFHTCSLVEGIFYIFGGVDDKKVVQNRLYCFEPSTCTWSEAECDQTRTKDGLKMARFNADVVKEPPTLSHHTATVVKDRFILFIGGWTGQKRTSDVFVFDTRDRVWGQVAIKGDVPVGLSSHTATLVSDQVVILGREGGVRTHRRSGDSFNFNLATGTYRHAMFGVASRSGHTANLVKSRDRKSYSLFIQGGRKDRVYEMIGSWGTKSSIKEHIGKDKIDALLSNMTVCQEPQGRQHCVSIELSDRYLLFYGGETWGGVRNNITNEVYVYDCQGRKWYGVKHSQNGPCLTGHAMGIVHDKVFIFGGLVGGTKCSENVWLLQL